MDLRQQRRIGGLGGLRPQARPARLRCRRCRLSSVNSVPMARSTVSSGRSSWNSSMHGATSQTAAAAARPLGRTGSGPGTPAGCSRTRVVGGGGLGEAQVAQCAGHLCGLAALAAGVEHPDLGVGELGRGHLGHRGARHLLAQPRLGRSVGWRRRWVAGRGLVDIGRPIQRHHPDQQRHHGQRGEQQDARAEDCAGGTGRPCLSKAVPSVICATTPAL